MQKNGPQILDGRAARAELKKNLLEKMKGLLSQPYLYVIQVGNRSDSDAYINGKKEFSAEINVRLTHVNLPESISQQEIIREIENANSNPAIHGIIVQLPLPVAIDTDAVINSIDPVKDIDGMTAVNVEKWLEGREDAIWPATTRGIRELFNFYKIGLAGKRVAMLGRSKLVGKPTAAMCVNENATVTVCHDETPNTHEITKSSDIVIVAIGKPRLIDASYVKEGQVIIDVGITSVGGKLVGDVNFDSVLPVIGPNGAITPVPGGVGQMTMLAIFENLVDACYNQNN